MPDKKEHFLFTDLGDVFLGKTTEDLNVGDEVTIKGVRYKVVGDSGDSRQRHEIYLRDNPVSN